MLSDKGQAVTSHIDRKALLIRLMDLPNRSWRGIMDAAANSVDSLLEPNTIKEVSE